MRTPVDKNVIDFPSTFGDDDLLQGMTGDTKATFIY